MYEASNDFKMSFCFYIFWNKLLGEKNCIWKETQKPAGFVCVIEQDAYRFALKNETLKLGVWRPWDHMINADGFAKPHIASLSFHIYFFEEHATASTLEGPGSLCRGEETSRKRTLWVP